MPDDGRAQDGTRTLGRCVRALVAASGLIPLALAPGSLLFFHTSTKVFLLRAVAFLALGLATPLLLAWGARRLASPWVLAAVAAQAVTFVVCAIFALDPRRSWWDDPSRLMGVETVAALVALFLAAAASARTWPQWRPILWTWLAAGIVQAAWAAGQAAGWVDALSVYAGRAGGALGNPVYLAGYGALTALVGVLVLVHEKARLPRAVAGAAAASGALCVVLSGTRGGLAALIAGAVAAFVTHIGVREGARPPGRWVRGAFAALAIVCAGTWAARDTAVVRALPLVGRIAGLRTDRGSVAVRMASWRVALDSGAERPVTGWGPNNFYHAFNRHYPPEIAYVSPKSQVVDNAHSGPLNAFAERGVAGLLSHLLWILAPWLALFSALRRRTIRPAVAAAGAGVAAAYGVHGLFAFDDVATSIAYTTFLAFVATAGGEDAADPAPRRSGVALALALAGAGGLVSATALLPARDSRLARDAAAAAAAHDRGALEKVDALDALREGAGPLHRVFVAQQLALAAPRWQAAGDLAGADALRDRAWSLMDDAVRAHPDDARLPILLAEVLRQRGVRAARADLETAERLLQRALAFAPHRQDVLFALAAVQLQLGKTDSALRSAQTAYRLEPRSVNSVVILSQFYAVTGRAEERAALLREARDRGVDVPQGR